MAIAKAFDSPFSDIKFEYEDIAIGGKLIKASMSISEFEYVQFASDEKWKDAMRTKLVSLFVDDILNKRAVEITTQADPISATRKIHGYFYLAPNDQVKLLRTIKR